MTKARTPVDRLRAICLALPGTIEKLSHGEPTWHAGGRMFAQLDDHHHGADRLAVWLAAALGDQEALVKADAARFFVPPYVGHRGWVGMRIDGRPDWRQVETVVRDAYTVVTAKAGARPRTGTSRGPRRPPIPR